MDSTRHILVKSKSVAFIIFLKTFLLWKFSNIHKGKENSNEPQYTHGPVFNTYQHFCQTHLLVSEHFLLLEYFKANLRHYVMSYVNTLVCISNLPLEHYCTWQNEEWLLNITYNPVNMQMFLIILKVFFIVSLLEEGYKEGHIYYDTQVYFKTMPNPL